jgi:hypothetical protein
MQMLEVPKPIDHNTPIQNNYLYRDREIIYYIKT